MNKTTTFLQPSRVYFGPNCTLEYADIFARAGKARLFVVSGRHASDRAAPLIAAWQAHGATVEIWNEVSREPEIALFEQALAAARVFQPDAVVGLGGGSALDVAKLVAALADGAQSVHEVFGIGLLRARAKFLVCIPTTAGTGSEVSPNAILHDEAQKTKRAVISPHLVPDVAYEDPALTLTVPSAVTATTGIDALTHCIEAYANRNARPLVDMFALEGIRRIGRSIETAVKNGSDLAARSDLMLGAYCGGMCLGPVNTAAVHALSYPLGGTYRLAHGLANSLLMPAVLRFNLAAMPARYAEIARALGVATSGSDLADAETGLARLVEISRSCGIPQRLRDVAVPEADLPRLAREAMKVERLLRNNPRELTVADAEQIYRAAY
ncbi:MAG: iron-containing alcohol dehydrogenase [Verrucomicrobia bacterium]|nr:iron-containing alcohol dehydrogenase [Verrucomicrobiota bacterium]